MTCAIRATMRSSTWTLHGSTNQLLSCMTPEVVSRKLVKFNCTSQDGANFQVVATKTSRHVLLLSVVFYDSFSGELCRVFTQGDIFCGIAIVYLERALTDPLAPLHDAGADLNRDCQAIGRITTKYRAFHPREISIEAAAGVDMSLLTLVWFVRFIALARHRNRR